MTRMQQSLTSLHQAHIYAIIKRFSRAKNKLYGTDMKIYSEILNQFKKTGLFPDLAEFQSSSTETKVKVRGETKLMFGSNNYLGLANDKDVVNKAVKVLKEHGVGPGGSRLLSGNLEFIRSFEHKLAEYVGVEDTITFPTGYMANLAVIPALMGPFLSTDTKEVYFDGVIFSDQYNHATIVDGCRLTPAKKVIYSHNNLLDLKNEIEKNSSIAHRLIITESVYSTEGTLTDVPEIVKIAKETNSILMIDDAHGIGVLGAKGGGVKSHFKLADNEPDVLMASFDKAMGTTGGFIGGSKEFIEYLRIASRPYIFSSAIPAVAAAATWGAIEKLERHPEIITKSHENASYLREKLIEAGFTVLGNGKTPAVPLLTGNEGIGIKFQTGLFQEGIYAPCFRWPASPAGKSRIRISVMSSHKKSDLDFFVNKSIKVGKSLGII